MIIIKKKAKSPSIQKLNFLRRIRTQEENSKKNSKINCLNLNQKKYFIYRHYSLKLYLNDQSFYDKFNDAQRIFNKQISSFKNQCQMQNIFLNNINIIGNNKFILNQKNKNNSNNNSNLPKNYYLKPGADGYPDIIRNLEQRGYQPIENPTKNNYKFLWTVLTIDVYKIEHSKDVIINHFLKNGSITRKSGLAKNLKNLYFKGINPHNFYPRCYNLSINEEFFDFLEDFKLNYVMSILKKYVIDFQNNNNVQNNNILEKYKENVIKLCIHIIERNMKFLCNEYDERENLNDIELISDEEWNLIYIENDNKNFNIQELVNQVNSNKTSTNEVKSSIQLPLINKFKNLNNNNNNNQKNNIYITKKINNINKKKKITSISIISKNKNEQIEKTNPNNIADPSIYLPIISKLLLKLSKFLPQYNLNGFRNIWILKPSNLSRGRGITCITSLSPILECMKETNNSGVVIQKYIENPLIIYNRKFDIRQWVLISSLEPLCIWLWDDPYLRFGSEDYNINDLNNIYGHLTNNSIGKHSENFGKNNIFEGDMWELKNFKNFLKDKFNGKDCWSEIKEKIKNIVIISFESCRYEMKYRSNSFELFGYDFMIDENLNVFLIEVNSSPAMDYSTKVTEKLVKEMSDDLMKIILDYNNNNNKNYNNVKVVGKFKKIFTGKTEINQSLVPNKNLPY